MSASNFAAAFADSPQPAEDRLVVASAGRDGEALRTALAGTDPARLSAGVIRSVVQGNLWMLTPEAFRHFLPAFMQASLDEYGALAMFVAELVTALTEPRRSDIVEALDRAAQAGDGMAIPPETMTELRRQQLEWFDSGTPATTYRERVSALTPPESAAVMSFLRTLREQHGEDFPFDEVQVAIDRHWAKAARSDAAGDE